MSGTSFETRCAILREVVDPDWAEEYDMVEFVEMNDLAFPLAISVTFGMAAATPKGVETINETWDALCDAFSADPAGEYSHLDQILELWRG
jgi:hypothetical protein